MAWQRPGDRAARPCTWRRAVDADGAARSRRRRARARRVAPVGGLSPRRRRARRPSRGSTRARPSRATCSRRTTCSTACAPRPGAARADRRLGDDLSRAVDRSATETTPLGARSPYATSKLAQEMLARRAWEDDGLPALLRALVQPRRAASDAVVRRAGIARQIALIEARPEAARADDGQPRAQARPHRRARHGARLRRDDGARRRRACPTTSAPGGPRHPRRSSTCSPLARACRSQVVRTRRGSGPTTCRPARRRPCAADRRHAAGRRRFRSSNRGRPACAIGGNQ